MTNTPWTRSGWFSSHESAPGTRARTTSPWAARRSSSPSGSRRNARSGPSAPSLRAPTADETIPVATGITVSLRRLRSLAPVEPWHPRLIRGLRSLASARSLLEPPRPRLLRGLRSLASARSLLEPPRPRLLRGLRSLASARSLLEPPRPRLLRGLRSLASARSLLEPPRPRLLRGLRSLASARSLLEPPRPRLLRGLRSLASARSLLEPPRPQRSFDRLERRDELADALVCLTEGDAARDECLCDVGRVQAAGLRGAAHRVRVERQRGNAAGERGARGLERVRGVEHRFLVLLQIAVVAERKPVQDRGHRDQVAEHTSGLRARQLRDIGVPLVRHHARAGRERLVDRHPTERLV